MNYKERLNKVIPGGSHTYSKGHDQFPSNAPEILSRGKGPYIFDDCGNKYLDYGMGLRSVNIGYAEDEINIAAFEQIKNGNNLTRPSMIELEAAELLVDTIDSVDMVKFTKNGSTAVSAAVKLARAYTGKNMIARCQQHPFFSYDDWFIGSTPITKGIPKSTIEMTKTFNYNDIESLEMLVDKYKGQFSCIVLEPSTTESPYLESYEKRNHEKISLAGDGRNSKKRNFLQQVQDLCKKHGIVFILDEMITGFRWHMKGAQHTYGVKPDLCTFGKAMANGFSVSCVAGRREIMDQGSIEPKGMERLFLLSTTHGSEMSGLGAFVKSMDIMKRESVVEHLWGYGLKIKNMMNGLSEQLGILDSFNVIGPSCSPTYVTRDLNKNISFELRTLFNQELIKNGVMMPWMSFCYRHGNEEFEITENAVHNALKVYAEALDKGADVFLKGEPIKPVFRKFN